VNIIFIERKIKYVYLKVQCSVIYHGSKTVSRYLLHSKVINLLMYIEFDTKFGLPSVMFTNLHHHVSYIYKPTTPLLSPHNYTWLRRFFSSIYGVLGLKYLREDLNIYVWTNLIPFLYAFAKLWKVILALSYSSVHMKLLCSHWKDFHEVLYLSIFLKFVEKMEVTLKSDKNKEYFTRKPTYIYDSLLH